MVKFLDLQRQYLSIKQEIELAINSVLTDAIFVGGEYVDKFESEFAEYQESRFCVGVGNGTDALEIAIEALCLPENSEIIVPANSFIASAEAVTRSGHRVVFCDCNERNYTISISSLKSKITSKTKAIIVVHIYGQPCDMDEILLLAKKFNFKIIEDCAQAHGAKYNGKRVGAIGDIGTFSFYPGKNLGAYGDGGAIITNNEELAKKTRMISRHGGLKKYEHQFEGRNSRLDSIQAAILSVKLKYLDSWTDARIKVANYYFENLKDIAGIILPQKESWAKQVYHLFVIRTKNRDSLKKYLKNNGIITGVHYPLSLPKLPAYAYLGQKNEDFFANRADSELLSLPMGDHMDYEELSSVVNSIRDFVNQ